MAKIASRVHSIEVSAIKQMPIIASRYSGTIRLDQGIPDFPMPKPARDYVAEAFRTDKGITQYTLQPGMTQLREAVSGSIKDKYGVAVDPENELFLSAGSIEGLLCTALTFLERGDAAALFSPAYEPHIQQVRLAEAEPVYFPLEEGSWRPDIGALENELKKGAIRLIYVCNPANPTGTVFTVGEVNEIAMLALTHDAVVVADEAYDFLAYDKPYTSFLPLFPEMKKNLIVTKTWSKSLAATGLRIGYVVACDEYLREMLKVHDSAVISAPTPGQYAALWALRNPNEAEKAVEEFRSELRRRRDLMHERIRGIPQMFEASTKPEGAYYFFPRMAFGGDSVDFASTLVREARVSVVPGAPFGPGGEYHVRMMFGAPVDMINMAFDRLQQYAASEDFRAYVKRVQKIS